MGTIVVPYERIQQAFAENPDAVHDAVDDAAAEAARGDELVVRGRLGCHSGRGSNVISKDELFELRMKKVRPELERFHLGERAVGSPLVVVYPIDRRHDARPVASANAMDVHRLILRVVHDLKESLQLSRRRRCVRCQRNLKILHTGGRNH